MDFEDLMIKRRALTEDIQFHKPGSPEYIIIDAKIKEIDKQKFGSDVRLPAGMIK